MHRRSVARRPEILGDEIYQCDSTAFVSWGVHWHVHEVLRYEPDLQLVPPKDVADQQIVCSIISRLLGGAGGVSGLSNNDLMGFCQS